MVFQVGSHRKSFSYWLLSLSSCLSFVSSFRKGSTGDGPREGELEDLHEDEPSSWVFNSFLFMSLSLNSPLHPHISFSDTLQVHQPIHWRQSDMSLVLTFRLVHSDSLWFLLYYFLPHFPSFSSVGSLGTNFNLKHFLPAQPLTAVTDIGESVRRGTPLNFWIINNSNCCCGKKTRTCLSAGITLQCGGKTVKLRLVFEPVTVYSHLSQLLPAWKREKELLQ